MSGLGLLKGADDQVHAFINERLQERDNRKGIQFNFQWDIQFHTMNRELGVVINAVSLHVLDI